MHLSRRPRENSNEPSYFVVWPDMLECFNSLLVHLLVPVSVCSYVSRYYPCTHTLRNEYYEYMHVSFRR
uniref:Uncharacterized protein n=1 Tax=Arundo donax TaxID=35708 RepID=A0A0A9TWA1_ARUDO